MIHHSPLAAISAILASAAVLSFGCFGGAALAGSARGHQTVKASDNAIMTAVSFADKNNGWVAGHSASHGYLFHTTDAGNSWNNWTVGWDGQSMEFIDPTHGWAVVESPAQCGLGEPPPSSTRCKWAIVHTSDGGHSWSLQLNGGACEAISSMDFITSTEGWAIESNSPCLHSGSRIKTKLMQTSNGGESWHVSLHPSTELTSAHFGTASDGWAVTDGVNGTSRSSCRTVLFHTTNAGQSWNKQFRVSGYCSGQVDFINGNWGWLLLTNTGACAMGGCYDYRLYHSRNGGGTWHLQQHSQSWAGSCGFLRQPHFVDSYGYIPVTAGQSCGTGGIDITRSGGHSWIRKAPKNKWVEDVSPVDSLNVWAVGCAQNSERCGYVLHTTDAGHHWTVNRP